MTLSLKKSKQWQSHVMMIAHDDSISRQVEQVLLIRTKRDQQYHSWSHPMTQQIAFFPTSKKVFRMASTRAECLQTGGASANMNNTADVTDFLSCFRRSTVSLTIPSHAPLNRAVSYLTKDLQMSHDLRIPISLGKWSTHKKGTTL